MWVDISDDWIPSAVNVNALPKPLRRYIHSIEVLDPQYLVQHNTVLRDQVRGLEKKLANMGKVRNESARDCPPHDFVSRGDGTARCKCGEQVDISETGAARRE